MRASVTQTRFLGPVCIFIGKTTLKWIEDTGDYAHFVWEMAKRLVSPPWRWRLILEQMYLIGVKSFPIALVTAVFVGMVMVLQIGVQLVKFGSKNYVPGIAFIANARELIPAFSAIVVGARVAASITAQLGTMRVTEQIDALEVLNVDPYRYLVVPRVIAMTILLPLITGLAVVGAYLGGAMVGESALNIDDVQYFTTTLKFAYPRDLFSGLAKTVFFGALIAVTGCYFGFRTSGGAEGVGRATTNSVVLTLLLIFITNYVLTSIIMGLLGGVS